MLSTVLQIPSERGVRDGCGGGGAWWSVCPECRLPVPSETSAAGQAAELALTGWYHGRLSWRESAALLAPTKEGTFLARDSSDPRFAYSLSVQTRRGPVSVRLCRSPNGHLRLDAEPRLVPSLPWFPSVAALVHHYSRPPNSQLWVDWTGSAFSEVLLSRPLLDRRRPPPLQHLARLAFNNAPEPKPDTKRLPKPLQAYLNQYPYSL